MLGDSGRSVGQAKDPPSLSPFPFTSPNALGTPVTHLSLPRPVQLHACATAAILSLHPTFSQLSFCPSSPPDQPLLTPHIGKVSYPPFFGPVFPFCLPLSVDPKHGESSAGISPLELGSCDSLEATRPRQRGAKPTSSTGVISSSVHLCGTGGKTQSAWSTAYLRAFLPLSRVLFPSWLTPANLGISLLSLPTARTTVARPRHQDASSRSSSEPTGSS